MALHINITRGYTVLAGVAPSVADWNALGLPNISLDGSVGGTDIGAGSITFSHLNRNAFAGLTAASALSAGDKIPFYASAADSNQSITAAKAADSLLTILPENLVFTAYATDYLPFYNGTGASRMPVKRIAENLIGQASELTTTTDSDQLLVSQAAADVGSRAKRVAIGNLLPDKATPGTYSGVTGLTLDSKGRVTAVTAVGGSGVRFTASGVTVPFSPPGTNTPTASAVTAHGFGGLPTEFAGFLQCTSATSGYSVGDIVPLWAVVWAPLAGSTWSLPALTAKADATNLLVIAHTNAASMYIPSPSVYGGSPATSLTPFVPANWAIRWSAWK